VSLLRSPKATDITRFVLNRFLAGTSEIGFRVPVRTHSSSHSASTTSTTRPASHPKEIAVFYPESVKPTTHLHPVPMLKCVESYLHFSIRLYFSTLIYSPLTFTMPLSVFLIIVAFRIFTPFRFVSLYLRLGLT
jgi:hypothetical protein